jgi:RNA polymerase sigma-70 factor (ECF subfamily)
MGSDSGDAEDLVRRAAGGDSWAMNQLMDQHRSRLRRMVAVRMDPRLAARVDPSDVVQETLAEAAEKLPSYLQDRSLPFYPWLRELAWENLVRLHRQHVQAQCRSVTREQRQWMGLSDESAMTLAGQLVAGGTSPSGRLIREEVRDRVRSALDRLSSADREILVMRHLEQLQVSEIAAILRISEGAVMMRRLRAFERLRQLLTDQPQEEAP